jgi:hypothetical protein
LPGIGVEAAHVHEQRRVELLGVIRRHQGKGIFVTDPNTWLRAP